MAFNFSHSGWTTRSPGNRTEMTQNDTSPSSLDNPFELPLSLMASAVVVANALVCALFCQYRKLRTITNTFVASLAVSDVLVATVFVPSFLIMNYVKEVGYVVPYIIAYILFAYLFNFCGVTYDRYQAIVRPLSYHAKMTRKMVNKILVMVWTIPMVIALVPIFWHTQPLAVKILANQINQGLLIFTVTVISVTICCAFTKIFRETRRQVKNMAVIMNRSPNLNPRQNANGTHNEKSKHFSRKLQLNIAVEVKAAKVFAVLIITFSICWFPLIFINIIEAIGYGHLVPRALINISLFTLVGNSLLDPLIYSFYKTDFRNAMRKFCCCGNKRRNGAQFNSNGSEHYSQQTARLDSTSEVTPSGRCCAPSPLDQHEERFV